MCLALAIIATAIAACGSTSSPASSTAASVSPSAPPTPDPSSPAGRLATALGTLANAYTFESSVTVAGKVATKASGQWVADTSQVTVSAAGRDATYRTVGAQAWVQQGDGSWVLADTPLPSGDPVSAFGTPIGVTEVGADANGRDLVATYPPAALGLTGDTPVSVKVHITPQGVVTLTYESTVTAGPATSTTTLKPAAGLQPFPVPSSAAASPSG